ncbi:MAG: hypothetical protein ACRYF3_16265, partial [Janthinobacterium lividum]
MRGRGHNRGLRTAPPLLGRYVPGSSALHRAGAGAKLLGLALLGLSAGSARTLLPESLAAVVLLLLAGAVATTALACGLGPAHLLAQLRRLRWVLLVLGAVQVWQSGPLRALVVLGALVSCLWAAATV